MIAFLLLFVVEGTGASPVTKTLDPCASFHGCLLLRAPSAATVIHVVAVPVVLHSDAHVACGGVAFCLGIPAGF